MTLTADPIATPRQAAEAAEQAARAEQAAWSTHRVEQGARGKQIGRELDEITGRLAGERASALRGEDKAAAIAELVTSRKTLEAEAAEVAELLKVAESEEARARVALEPLAAEAARLVAEDVHATAAARATELDAQIDGAYGALVALLNERAGIAKIPFDWRRIPSVASCRSRIPLPGAW